MLSRITLGDHGFNQVIMGFLISFNFILYFDYKIFIVLMHHLKSRLKSFMLALSLVNVIILLVMNYVNH